MQDTKVSEDTVNEGVTDDKDALIAQLKHNLTLFEHLSKSKIVEH